MLYNGTRFSPCVSSTAMLNGKEQNLLLHVCKRDPFLSLKRGHFTKCQGMLFHQRSLPARALSPVPRVAQQLNPAAGPADKDLNKHPPQAQQAGHWDIYPENHVKMPAVFMRGHESVVPLRPREGCRLRAAQRTHH